MNHRKNSVNPWGPENPHPLSRLKTELVWEGKYDEYGNRRPIKLPTSSLPLQRIETIDEPRDRSKAQGLLWKPESAHRDDFRNLLIWGDNKLAMAAMLEQFRGKVDLIYIDPPFDVGADFTMRVALGDEGETLQKEQSILEAVAYRDTWGKGTDSYLHMMYERMMLMQELLSSKGSIYVHSDAYMSPWLRYLMSEVFGADSFRNEIYWYYTNKIPDTRKRLFTKSTDTIIFYAGRENYFQHQEEERETPIKVSKMKKVNGKKIYVRGDDGKVEMIERNTRVVDNVWKIAMLHAQPEITGFSTQKPEALLERIIKASSEEGDLIADFFCGSGTTMAVAEKLGRRWIGVDLGRYATHVSRKRLIQVQRELHSEGKPYRSFDVYNLGRYERQWWQTEKLKGADGEHRRIVLQFYKAAVLEHPPNPLLHGKKHGAFVHVDRIDSIFAFPELKAAAEAAQSAGGRELHCLAWEFEMELAAKKQAIETETGLTIRLKYIPREIMESNRSECQFFEAGYLEAKAVTKGKKVDVALLRFSPALAEAPEAEMEELQERAVKSPFDFIDFWAVDFEWRDDKPFEHHWQDFRTRKDRSLKTRSDLGWEYSQKGSHQICVKVIDVFGVDTTTVIQVEV
jgi:adenine-specific DNA-methyltransferase